MMMRNSPPVFTAHTGHSMAHSVAQSGNFAHSLRHRGAPLLAMLLLHALLIGLWWHHTGDRHGDAVNPSTALTLIWAALPLSTASQPTVTLPRTVPRSRSQKPAPAAPAAPAVFQAITRSSPATPVDAVPDPAPVPVRTLTLDALQQVGAIDRALRAQTPVPPSVSTHLSTQDTFGHAIASAGVHSALAPRMEQRIMPDGRAIIRVTTGGGSYCVIQAGAGATDGIDHAQRGNSPTTKDCGHLFD